MKIFVGGGSGVVGRYLVPQLIGAGHEVVAMTRPPGKISRLRGARRSAGAGRRP